MLTRSLMHRWIVKAVQLLISGRVQGVGFRQFVMAEAGRRGLAGWTRNLGDGRVEAVISGPDDIVDDLIAACRRGPSGASVRSVEVIAYDGLVDARFSIRPTA